MLVIWLDDQACQDVAAAGGKAANLSRYAARYPVPRGFCLTAEAYQQWVAAGRASPMPEGVGAALSDAYQTMRHTDGPGPVPVAVRSSATAEDGATASFAGQYTTRLNVSGITAVGNAVTECWRSARGERVRTYRQRQGRNQADDSVAVLVQELIVADVAFVAFSANPVTGDHSEITINSNWGLGESIVNGNVIPDTFIVRKGDGELIKEVISDKEAMTIVCSEGVRAVPVPRALRRQRSLLPSEVGAITNMARQLESEAGRPVDIEGAIKDDQIYLLQCRPITTR